MSEFNKYSTDGGATFIDVEDSNAVHYGDQSKGYVGKNKWITDGAIGSGTGISFTRNSNGTVDVSAGTTTSECIYPASQTLIYDDGSLEKSKDYIVSYGNTTHIDWVYIQVFKKTTSSSSWEKIAETSTSASLTFTVPSTFYCLWVRFLFANGKSFSATTLYPMIRLASIPDSTYEPYLTPNTEIDNKLSYADNAVLGAKNLTRRTIANGTTEKTVVVTVNSDDSVTLNGTATGGTAWIVFSNGETKLKKGTYKISGLPSDGSGSTFGLFIRPHGQSAGTDIFVNDTLFTVNEDTVYDLLTPVRGNYTANNLTIKPMIRLASDTDNTYVPYAMTNRELTEQVNDLTSTKISGKKVSGTVSGSSVTFTDADLTSDSIIDGPYVGGMVMRIDSVTPSTGSVTFTFTSSSASGQPAYIWIR